MLGTIVSPNTILNTVDRNLGGVGVPICKSCIGMSEKHRGIMQVLYRGDIRII